MQLTKNVRSALVFYAVMMLFLIYDVLGMLTHPQWGAKMPSFVMSSMDFQIGLLFPLLLLASAAFIVLVLDGDRRGMIGMVAIGGVVNVVWNLFAAYWRFSADAPYGAAVCAIAIVFGVAVIYFGLRAVPELALRARLQDDARVRT